MSSKKMLIKNKPTRGEMGVYTYKTTTENTDSYKDSDSVALRYDKFEGQDLYSTSVGDSINASICDSKIQSTLNPYNSDDNTGLSDLRFTGQNFIEINYVDIQNTGVNSNINDVYFEFFIFSKIFFNPYNSDGSKKSYDSIKNGMKQSGSAARFFYQSGPNYSEDREPGKGLFTDIQICENFDVIGNSITFGGTDDHVLTGSNTTWIEPAPYTAPRTSGPRDEFNPTRTILMSVLDGSGNEKSSYENPHIANNNLTTVFNEDGEANPIYIGAHMDGDLNPTNGPDRSRKQSVALWSFDASDLFDFDTDGNPIPKVTTLEWDNHEIWKEGGHGKAAAWTGRGLKVTINTLGGIGEDTPEFGSMPSEYSDIIADVTPPIGRYDQDSFDSMVTQMNPYSQLQSSLPITTNFWKTFYDSPFADYMPVSYVELSSNVNLSDNDFQIYYEDSNERIIMSAPNLINLSFDVTIVAEQFGNPFDLQQETAGKLSDGSDSEKYPNGHPYHNIPLYSFYPSEDTNFWTEAVDIRSKFSDSSIRVYSYNPSGDNTDTHDIGTEGNTSYCFFVIDWDDRDDKYETIDDVLVDWPRSQAELADKKAQNLYHPQWIDNTASNGLRNNLNNFYSTPGIKTIKTIMFSHNTVMDDTGVYNNPIEPLRWKLITTRVFLDIPTNEFPDFGTVGGDDYVTLPWPYTTPIIGGISEESKYYKSINDILGGGKIGDLDIIDETFLVESKENDEVGDNVEKLDLEQIRYFSTGVYDINNFLNIPTEQNQVVDNSRDYLGSLPFPFYWEEFNVAGPTVIQLTPPILNMTWEYNDLQITTVNIAEGITQITHINSGYTAQLNNDVWIGELHTLITGENYTFYTNQTVNWYLPPLSDDNQYLDSNDLTLWSNVGRPDIADYMYRKMSNLPINDSFYIMPSTSNDGGYYGYENYQTIDDVPWPPPHHPIGDQMFTSEKDEDGKWIGGSQTMSTPPTLTWMGGNPIVMSNNDNLSKPPSDDDSVMGGQFGGGYGGSSEECFVAGTKVKLSNGLEKNIEDVKVGEEVLSYNIHTEKLEPQKVTKLFTQVHNLVGGDITVKTKFNNSVETHNTIANPFWSKDKGFVAADADRCNELHQWVKETNDGKDTEQLEVGDTLYHYNGEELQEVKVIEIEKILEPNIRTYDITIEDNHTFFANGILTHNSGTGGGGWSDDDFDDDNNQPVYGCRDPKSCTYNPEATISDPQACYYGQHYRVAEIIRNWIGWFQAMPDYNWDDCQPGYFLPSDPDFPNSNEEGARWGEYYWLEHFDYDMNHMNDGECGYAGGVNLEDQLQEPIRSLYKMVATTPSQFLEDNLTPHPYYQMGQQEIIDWAEGLWNGTGQEYDSDYDYIDDVTLTYPTDSSIYTPDSPFDELVLPNFPIQNGCDLAPYEWLISNNGDLLYNVPHTVEIQGVQLHLPFPYDMQTHTKLVEGDEGYEEGVSLPESWVVAKGAQTILMFDMTEGTTVSGCGTMVNLNLSPNDWNPNTHGSQITYTFSDNMSNAIPMVYYQYPSGCTDILAENFDPFAAEDDGSCTYPAYRFPGIYYNIDPTRTEERYIHLYNEVIMDDEGNIERYWNGEITSRTFSEESSVGEIFIGDTSDLSLYENCKLEFNMGNLTNKSIYDSSGNSNKGLLIGDYKIKKAQKNEPMRRDSYIKLPQKTKTDGAL